ncbi:MAG: hemY [Francisellaceae bacterium]|nr:hemY [Francisellaceae bacterium]
MNISIIIFIIILAVSTVIGIFIAHDPGYTLFSYGNWTVEMPLWLTFTIILILISLTSCLFIFLNSLSRLSPAVKSWLKNREIKLAFINTQRGLKFFTEGDWLNAEKWLIKASIYPEYSLMNYIFAAKAAHERGDAIQRESYLAKALSNSFKDQSLLTLIHTEFQLKQSQESQNPEAIKVLEKLVYQKPNALKLLFETFINEKDWEKALELLPAVEKRKIFEQHKLDNISKLIYMERLNQLIENLKELNIFWGQLPKFFKQNTNFIYVYAKALIQLEQHKEAEQILRQSLEQTWDEGLIALYGKTVHKNNEQQLKIAENWVEFHSNSPNLYLTLGRIALRAELWGKARSFLEQYLSMADNPEAYVLLGNLLEFINCPEESRVCFKKGLLKVVNDHVKEQNYLTSNNNEIL